MKKIILGLLIISSITTLANTTITTSTTQNTTTKNQELQMKVAEATTNTIVITISKK